MLFSDTVPKESWRKKDLIRVREIEEDLLSVFLHSVFVSNVNRRGPLFGTRLIQVQNSMFEPLQGERKTYTGLQSLFSYYLLYHHETFQNNYEMIIKRY